jgi:hypothetical protein
MPADQAPAQSEWKVGDPPVHGYYLAAWRRGGDILAVSELWFNPDAHRSWWFSRGYAGQSNGEAVRAEVVAWMSMPDPPEVLT